MSINAGCTYSLGIRKKDLALVGPMLLALRTPLLEALHPAAVPSVRSANCDGLGPVSVDNAIL